MEFDINYLSKLEEQIYTEGTDLKEQGAKIIGIYCAFTPRELISAAGAIPVALCAGSQKPVEAAEKHLPRNLCALIKSSYGHALESSCPYFNSCDFLLADSTCDGKKKMFELLNRIKPLHLLQLPQNAHTPESLDYWLKELYKVKALLEEKTGNLITDEKLREQIKLYNRLRQCTQDIFDLNKGEFPLLHGKEIDYITGARSFDCNLEQRIKELQFAVSEIKKRATDETYRNLVKNKPRILLTGCPTTNKKVFDLIENCGGIIVAMENCGGLKTCGSGVREDIDPMQALAEKYLSIACPCMSPNPERLTIIGDIIKDYKIQGVIELTWQGCHTYNVEAFQIKEFVNNSCGSDYLQIETDYSENDIGQIKVRIEAFLELLA